VHGDDCAYVLVAAVCSVGGGSGGDGMSASGAICQSDKKSNPQTLCAVNEARAPERQLLLFVCGVRQKHANADATSTDRLHTAFSGYA
jgi:hypothetical protein